MGKASRAKYASRQTSQEGSLLAPKDIVSTEDGISITTQVSDIMQTEQQKEAAKQDQRSPKNIIDSIIEMMYAKIDSQVYQQLVQLEQSLRQPLPKEEEPKKPEE